MVDNRCEPLAVDLAADERAGDEIAARTVTGDHRLSLTARGVASGPWIHCATLTADVSGFGFASCVAAAVAP